MLTRPNEPTREPTRSGSRPDEPKEANRRSGLRPRNPIDRLASRATVTVTGFVFVAFAITFFGSSASFSIPHVEEACGAPPLDMRFRSSADDVHQFLTDCGPTGRDAYRNLQIADLAYPAVSGLFLASALALTARQSGMTRRWTGTAAAIPLLGSLFDYIENGFVWTALASYPNPAPTDPFLGFASAAKNVTFWIAGVGLLFGVAVLGVQAAGLRVRKRAAERG